MPKCGVKNAMLWCRKSESFSLSLQPASSSGPRERMCAWSRLASSAMNGRRRIFLTMIDSWDDFHPAPIHPRPQATWSDFPTHGRGHPMLGGREGQGRQVGHTGGSSRAQPTRPVRALPEDELASQGTRDKVSKAPQDGGMASVLHSSSQPWVFGICFQRLRWPAHLLRGGISRTGWVSVGTSWCGQPKSLEEARA